MPRLTKIKETCLYVNDLDRCREFYNGVLGLEVISQKTNRHVFFRVGDEVLLCFLPESTRTEETLTPHFAYGQQHFAFECPTEDLDDWKKLLIQHEVAIEREIEWSDGIRSIYFRDPDMHSVEIVVPGLWS